MKIILAIYPRNDKILHIKYTLESLGHEVRLLGLASYREQCSYAMKKIDKLGIHHFKNKYNRNRYNELLHLLKQWQPDRLLFIDLPENVFSYDELCQIKQMTNLNRILFQIWLVDPLKRTEEEIKLYRLFDKVFSYEKGDVIWLKRFRISAYFCPVGYSKDYETAMLTRLYKKDIVFVGTPYSYRLMLLEAVAHRANIEKWSLQVYGPFFCSRYPWKKILFKKRYPHLYPCIKNGVFSSKQIAEIYKSSRICLNIHGNGAGSCNPRTYEILATGSFEIIDKRSDYDILEPGRDIIVFQDKDDLQDKIEYYLVNSKAREKLAANGYNKVKNKRTIKSALEDILTIHINEE